MTKVSEVTIKSVTSDTSDTSDISDTRFSRQYPRCKSSETRSRRNPRARNRRPTANSPPKSLKPPSTAVISRHSPALPEPATNYFRRPDDPMNTRRHSLPRRSRWKLQPSRSPEVPTPRPSTTAVVLSPAVTHLTKMKMLPNNPISTPETKLEKCYRIFFDHFCPWENFTTRRAGCWPPCPKCPMCPMCPMCPINRSLRTHRTLRTLRTRDSRGMARGAKVPRRGREEYID